MTDEQKLHKMMANPGRAPAYDANGWPTALAKPVTVDGVEHKPGIFIADVSGDRYWVCRTCEDDHFIPAWPCAPVQSAAGPAAPSFEVGHLVEFRSSGRMIVGVVEGFDEKTDGLELDCGLEGRWTVTPEECRPWGPAIGTLPGDIPTDVASAAAPSSFAPDATVRPGERALHVQHGLGKVHELRPDGMAFVLFDKGLPQGRWVPLSDLLRRPADWPLTTDSADPAPSSASTSGTDGRHREAWHQLVKAWRDVELHPTSSNSAHMQRRYAEGALVMYLTLTGQDEDTVLPEIGRALDDLYGTDRDKRGVPC